ncbi:MAG: hypothetical protein IPM29_17970 [Planctomycetes bacterium]|nr:hypothetical protein [Planctomycetota bacterium]
MRRFRFRPERLLSLERRRERAARREVARHAQAVAGLERRLQHLAASREACLADGVARSLGVALADGLGRVADGLAGELRSARRQLDRTRDAWLERRSAQRALESLRARELAAWRLAVARDEARDTPAAGGRPAAAEGTT